MKPFELAEGNSVPNLVGIHPCYEVIERIRPESAQPFYSFAINISVGSLRPLLEDFCRQLEPPCFFLCETPASQQEEEKLRRSEDSPLHCNVYYKDGCTNEQLLALLQDYGEWFIQDGMSCFGFASHQTKDEIYVGKYKIVNIFTQDEERYQALLARHGIPREEKIKTVWENFSAAAPGECALITRRGRTVYDIVEELLQNGMYLAQRREA